VAVIIVAKKAMIFLAQLHMNVQHKRALRYLVLATVVQVLLVLRITPFTTLRVHEGAHVRYVKSEFQYTMFAV